MKASRSVRFETPALVLLWIAMLPLAAAAQTYTITDLGTLEGNSSGARGISVNDACQIVGYGTIKNQEHAFLLTPQ